MTSNTYDSSSAGKIQMAVCPGCHEEIPRISESCIFCGTKVNFMEKDRLRKRTRREYVHTLQKQSEESEQGILASVFVLLVSLIIIAVSGIGVMRIGEAGVTPGIVCLGFIAGIMSFWLAINGIKASLKKK